MQISEAKKEKISEQILSFLYSSYPRPEFTSQIAKEIARDEEFIRGLLHSLKNKKIISEIKKNPKGIQYIKRTRWKLNDNIYQKYNTLSRNNPNTY